MLVVPTELRPSRIHGIGAFLLAPVKKGDLIWHFDSRVDRIYSHDDIENLPFLARQFVKTYGTYHKHDKLWMICGDNARHFNHAEIPTTVSLGSGGLADNVAAHDMSSGTELTSDYRIICDFVAETGKLSAAEGTP
jgi:SET domain-containing protein